MVNFNTIKQGENKSGKVFVVGQIANGNYRVYTKKTSYQQGRDVTRWVFCQVSLKETPNQVADAYSLEVATALFNKKLKTTAKP